MTKAPSMLDSPRHQGFTLIELVVTISILAILVSIGIPSFVDMTRNSQISAQTNNLVTTLALARSEASKRRLPITVCVGISGTCSGSTDWSQGWLAFLDTDGDSAIDAGDTVLQQSSTPPTGMTINAQDSLATPLSSFTYQRDGRSSVIATFTIRKTGCGANQQRQLSINLAGRSQLTKQNCP